MASKNAKRATRKFENSSIGKIILFVGGIVIIIIALVKLLTTGSLR